MTKNKIPWIYRDTFDPYYSSEENELEDNTEEATSGSEPESNYPYEKEIQY